MTKIVQILIFFGLLSTDIFASELPKYSIFPIRTQNINAESRSRLQKLLSEEQAKMRAALWQSPKKLSEWKQVVGLNNRKMSQGTWVASQAKSGRQTERPIAIEPVWCHFMEKDLLFVQVVDLKLGTLLASSQKIFNRGSKRPYNSRLETLREKWPGQLVELADDALNKALNRGSSDNSALHLQVMSRRQSDWKNRAVPECMIMMAEEKLAQEFTVVRQLGLERLQHLRQNLGMVSGLRRPTRVLNLYWSDSLSTSAKRSRWDLNAYVNTAEGVFGQPYPIEKRSPVVLRLEQKRFSLEIPEKIVQHLRDESKNLALNEQPKIIHIYRAWAYLDKGRAWGLKMKDRLVERQNPNEIQGHVVRYFGAEAKLKNASGQLIHEGAIVFIRKGQDKVAIGQTLDFDPKTYPAAWR